MKDEKAERRVKVYLKNSVWMEGLGGKAVKINKGFVVLMSADEVKLFGKAVTKDIPDGAEEFEGIS
tara:strand:+ start:1105 stop:1302 length:198 start_codon:yes stop_codon:yes gene_type:complete